jgi:predicted transcriptional regulator
MLSTGYFVDYCQELEGLTAERAGEEFGPWQRIEFRFETQERANRHVERLRSQDVNAGDRYRVICRVETIIWEDSA